MTEAPVRLSYTLNPGLTAEAGPDVPAPDGVTPPMPGEGPAQLPPHAGLPEEPRSLFDAGRGAA